MVRKIQKKFSKKKFQKKNFQKIPKIFRTGPEFEVLEHSPLVHWHDGRVDGTRQFWTKQLDNFLVRVDPFHGFLFFYD